MKSLSTIDAWFIAIDPSPRRPGLPYIVQVAENELREHWLKQVLKYEAEESGPCGSTCHSPSLECIVNSPKFSKSEGLSILETAKCSSCGKCLATASRIKSLRSVSKAFYKTILMNRYPRSIVST